MTATDAATAGAREGTHEGVEGRAGHDFHAAWLRYREIDVTIDPPEAFRSVIDASAPVEG